MMKTPVFVLCFVLLVEIEAFQVIPRTDTHGVARLPVTALFSKSKRKKKDELMKAVGEKMKNFKPETEEESSNRLLDNLFNPFMAGQNLRRTIDTAFSGLGERTPSIYQIDEFNQDPDYVPEVLVVGATSEIGQQIVRQMNLSGDFKVRVLVNDLYTQTLAMFGVSTTYCQGDLGNVDSLEYAVTDVDKIVFCVEESEEKTFTGFQNLVRAYQDVRHADYGTSQAAKRSLFRFERPEDFFLFEVEGEMEDEEEDETGETMQVQWMRNQFENGVFVGDVFTEASIRSSRLRSRENPDQGIDFAPNFAGFICRACSDGGTYEAFIRTGEYFESGVEYVCEFTTATKSDANNASKNKFSSIRLPFENFEAVGRDGKKLSSSFDGKDVRNIGFRFRNEKEASQRFYLALAYMKLFRSQPEPEFVLLSDSKVPNLQRGIIDIDASTDPESGVWKAASENFLKTSGLSYSIVRVSGFLEESAGAELREIELSSTPSTESVSRADVAQICTKALLDPQALNKSFSVNKAKMAGTEDVSEKFSELPLDTIA